MNVRAVGVAVAVQAALIVKLTGMVCGLPVTGVAVPPVPVTVIEPVYVLGVSVPNTVAVALSLTDWFAVSVPLLGETASHAPPTVVAAVAFHVSVPPPVFVNVVVCGGGELPCPITLVKVIAVDAIAIIGVVGWPIAKLTVRLCVPVDVLKLIELL